MATWATHLMIADAILREYPALHRRGYCVGSIAPDCNVENADWTAFTPSREVTHWMIGRKKAAADCDRFRSEYLIPHMAQARSPEEQAFLLGYYSHLIADAEFQRYIRDEARVRATWERIKADEALRAQADGLPETWDSVKALIPKDRRMLEIESIEAAYLEEHPDSGYLTDILPLKSFPDYLDYLPSGSIVRKIGIMGSMPRPDQAIRLISISGEEYANYVRNTVFLVSRALEGLI